MPKVDVNSYLNINKKLNMELVKNKIKNGKTIEIADRIKEHEHNLPYVLQAVFQQDTDRVRDQSEDEVNCLKQYETRRLNMYYNSIIEGAARNRLKEQVRIKKEN